MHHSGATDDAGSVVEMRLQELEEEMPHFYLRLGGLFALASAWAERYDAILALAPAERRRSVQMRLARIGIQWGVMPEADAPREFRIGDAERRTVARRSPGKRSAPGSLTGRLSSPISRTGVARTAPDPGK